jgi:hypothetical protein
MCGGFPGVRASLKEIENLGHTLLSVFVFANNKNECSHTIQNYTNTINM